MKKKSSRVPAAEIAEMRRLSERGFSCIEMVDHMNATGEPDPSWAGCGVTDGTKTCGVDDDLCWSCAKELNEAARQ